MMSDCNTLGAKEAELAKSVDWDWGDSSDGSESEPVFLGFFFPLSRSLYTLGWLLYSNLTFRYKIQGRLDGACVKTALLPRI